MEILDSVDAVRRASRRARASGRCVGLVPTMGALHAGHDSLIRRAAESAEFVGVSIYVNPMQFAPGEDLAAYPRTLESDLEHCRALAVDVVYCPSDARILAPDHTVYVDERELSAGLCGRTRPGHFRGVLTIVAKLFHIVEPDVAVFGRKDAQQARLIERMVRDLNMPVRIDIAPIVREADGLAMSSRNRYLSAAERKQALCLPQALAWARDRCRRGETAVDAIVGGMRGICEAAVGPAAVEYIEAVDWATLQPAPRVHAGVLLALAVRVGPARLIDNTLIGSD